MSRPCPTASPTRSSAGCRHVYDLIALAIGATAEGREIASQRGVGAARLAAIKADLIHGAATHLDQLAARQGITPRYV